MEELSRLASCDQAALTEVLAPFTDPSASLLEFRPTTPAPDTMVDISHESLIRQWPRLRQWADDENDQRRDFAGLLRRARTWARSGAGQRNILLEDDLSWAQRWLEGLGVYGSSDDALSAWAERQVKDALPAWTESFGGPVGAIRALCTRSEQVRDARQQEEQRQVEEAARQRELEGRLQAEAEKALADREAAKAQAALNEAKAQQVVAELAQAKAQSDAQRWRYAVYGVAVANRDLTIGTVPPERRDPVYQELAVLIGATDDWMAGSGRNKEPERLRVLESEIDRVTRQTLARTLDAEEMRETGAQAAWRDVVRECVQRAQAGARRSDLGQRTQQL